GTLKGFCKSLTLVTRCACTTLSVLARDARRVPRVADEGRQPWAALHNAFGVEGSRQHRSRDASRSRNVVTPPRLCRMTFTAALLWSLVASRPAAAQELHVSPSGDDGNNGAESAPLRTLATAVKQLEENGIVILHEGTYPIPAQVELSTK